MADVKTLVHLTLSVQRASNGLQVLDLEVREVTLPRARDIIQQLLYSVEPLEPDETATEPKATP